MITAAVMIVIMKKYIGKKQRQYMLRKNKNKKVEAKTIFGTICSYF